MTNFDEAVIAILTVIRSGTFVATIVTIPIYIILLYAFIKHRSTLGSSFFTICISEGIADIWWSLHKSVLIFVLNLIYGSVFSSTFLATYTAMGNWYIYGAEVLGVLLLAINRFTAMMWPVKYKQMWRKRNLIIGIALQWILPLPSALPMFFPCCYSYYHNETMHPTLINPEIEEYYFKVDVVIELMIISPALFILYICVFYKVWKQHQMVSPLQQRANSQSTQTARRKDRNSAIIGGLISGTYLLYMVSWSYALVNDWPLPAVLWFFIVNDVFTSLNPYLLICFSELARKAFLNVVTFGKVHV